MHPGNDAHALVGRAGLDARRENRLGVLDDRLPNHTNGNRLGFVKPGRDSLRVRGDLLQHRLAVQVLATCEKPDLEFAQRLQYDDSQFCAGVPPAESVDERRPTTGCTPPTDTGRSLLPCLHWLRRGRTCTDGWKGAGMQPLVRRCDSHSDNHSAG